MDRTGLNSGAGMNGLAPLDADKPSPVTLLAPKARHKIFLYLGALVTLLAFGDPAGGLMDVSISFLLKNKLHLDADAMAQFRLIAAIPLYLAGLFGFLRDIANPFGMKDRGFLVLFGAIGAALYLLFARTPPTAGALLVMLPLLTSIYLMLGAAENGLASALGQQHAMSGRVSAVWNIFSSLPGVAAFLAGGLVSDRLEHLELGEATRALFLGGAALSACTALFGLLRPKAVFDNVAARLQASRPLDDLRRLQRHRPIYPALAIWLFWNFAPGSQTPLQYYLQDKLHASDALWGEWNAVFSAGFIPTLLVYGLLCRRFPLKILLIWGTIAAIPQFIPLLFVHSAEGALLAAAPIGLMGGFATAAYTDLLIRSCPPRLEGTTLMLSVALYNVVSRFGDILGTRLYDLSGDFTACAGAITLVYALILPLIATVPKPLIAYRDGEAPQDSRLHE